MLAIQGQALHGHNESKSSFNKGNFIEMMHSISFFDDVIKKIMTGPTNARYLHHAIQSEIIHIMSNMILKKISLEIKEYTSSIYFSVMADEPKDISKVEQLSIVVRYYYHGELLKEKF